jgi:hypothetical protein
MAKNGYGGIGFTPYPPVPEKSINGDEKKFHAEGVVNNPAYHNHSPSSYYGAEPQIDNTMAYASKNSISPGIMKVYAATPPIYSDPNIVKEKVRIVSAPIGADVLKFEREKELEREMERERMGSEWEVARKRGTGEPVESEVGDGLARWR